MDNPSEKTIKLVVAYDGTRFKGWQRGSGRTVQGVLEDSLSRALGPASDGAVHPSAPIPVVGAGRTDAGVHAEGQVASARIPARVRTGALLGALDAVLPDDLAVLSVEDADDRFHARYRATAKTYRYRIVDGPVSNPFLYRYAYRVRGTLDVGSIRSASAAFLGERDFTSFTADKGKKDKMRTVFSIDARRDSMFGLPVLDLVFRGDGFLWNQIRIMAAALVSAGTGELDATGVHRLLDARDRSLAPPPCPACGLTLVSVEYGNG